MNIVSILFPVFSLVLIGYLYARLYKPDLQPVNQIMLWIFVPALVFDIMSNQSFHIIEYRWLALAGLIVVLLPGIFAWLLAWLMDYPKRAFVPTMMFNNCGNLGLPLAVLAYGESGLEGAIVLFLVSNLLHFSLGTWLFGGIVSCRGLLLNPVNLATFAGLLVNFLRLEIPQFIIEPISLLGQIVIPFMLFSLGVRMLNVNTSLLGVGVVCGISRPLFGLAAAAIAVLIIPLDEFQFGLLFLFAALPPAVLNFLFAEQYQQNPALVADMVVVANAMSVLTIGLVLLWLV